MTNILEFSIQSLVTQIKTKIFSVEEVVRCYLQRQQEVNDHINAIVQNRPEQLLVTARIIDNNLSQYLEKPLLGVPVTVKNVCHVTGYRPDKGCVGLVGKVSKEDATVVSRLRQAGALIIGLTNTPELSIGYETDNLLYGQTKNPYDLDRTPGGSSGGEAAAISSRCSLVGLGTDATGSLRVPAHYTGCTAIKMTQGRVPLTGSIPIDTLGLFSQFISFGPMARCVADLREVASVIVGPDGVDPHVVPVPWPAQWRDHISGLKVVFYDDDGISVVEPEIKQSIQHVAKLLSAAVRLCEEKRPPYIDKIEEILGNSILLGGDGGRWLEDILQHLEVKYPSPLILEYLELAKQSHQSVTELRKNWIQFDEFRKNMLNFIQAYDVIVCPVAATVAKPHGQSFKDIKDISYCLPYSLVNWPVIVIPVAVNREGLPIGIQIIAKPWCEDVAFAIAEYLENQIGVLSLKLKV